MFFILPPVKPFFCADGTSAQALEGSFNLGRQLDPVEIWQDLCALPRYRYDIEELVTSNVETLSDIYNDKNANSVLLEIPDFDALKRELQPYRDQLKWQMERATRLERQIDRALD